MKKILEPIIFYVLLTLTIITISYIAYNYIKGKVEDVKIEFVYTNEDFNIEDFIKRGYAYKEDSVYTPKRYTALFLAASTGCSACMGQFQIYNRLILETNLNDLCNRTLAVVDTNINHANWFARVNQLKINAIADIPIEMKNILLMFRDETYEKQLIIIDNVTRKIKMRIKVKVGIQVTYEEIEEVLPGLLSKIGIVMYKNVKQ